MALTHLDIKPLQDSKVLATTAAEEGWSEGYRSPCKKQHARHRARQQVTCDLQLLNEGPQEQGQKVCNLNTPSGAHAGWISQAASGDRERHRHRAARTLARVSRRTVRAARTSVALRVESLSAVSGEQRQPKEITASEQLLWRRFKEGGVCGCGRQPGSDATIGLDLAKKLDGDGGSSLSLSSFICWGPAYRRC